MTTSVIIWTALVPWLLLVWIFQRVSGLSGLGGLFLVSALALGVVVFPWLGHPLPYWTAGLGANFSVILAGLLVLAILRGGFSCSLFRPRDWRATWCFGALGAILLYPSALGLGPGGWDVYALGWPWLSWGQSFFFFASAGVASAGLILVGNRFGYLLLLALLASALGMQESDNLWDYLLDPAYASALLVAVLYLAGRRYFGGRG